MPLKWTIKRRVIATLSFFVGVSVLYVWLILPVVYPNGYIHNYFGIKVSQPRCIPESEKYYVTISTIVKNRANYMAEWIEFHLMHGVQHIYIYDNESTDNLAQVLWPYIKKSLVTQIPFKRKTVILIDGTEEIMTQKLFLANTIETHACETRWMAMIDVDEFVFAAEKSSLVETLQRYESFTSVVIPWLYFTSNGWVTKPPTNKLVIEAYTRRWKKPKHTWKHILQPKRIKSVYSVHNYLSVPGYHSVNEKMTHFANWPSSLNGHLTRYIYHSDTWYSSEVFRLHHYKTKSAEDWEDRLRTSEVSGSNHGLRDIDIKRHWEEYFQLQNVESEGDTTMMKYVEPLRKKLQERFHDAITNP